MTTLEAQRIQGLRRPVRALRAMRAPSLPGTPASGNWIDLAEVDPDPRNKESLLLTAGHPGSHAERTTPGASAQAPLVLTALAQTASMLMPWRRLGWAAAGTAVALGVGTAILVRRLSTSA